jgi:conjugative transfer pilus assembly protein TraH
MKPRQWTQNSLALIALTCFVVVSTDNVLAANLQGEIDTMFTNLGAVGNYTQPGAFRGQAYNTYAGGSTYLRSPNKVYQLATIQFPYIKAGCGGIDVFAGSFSHLAAAEFKNVLKSITANLPGVAFQLALSAVTPLLGQKAEWAKSLETFVTNARINSCETATSLVRGAANATGFDAFSSCVRIAIELGLESDEDAARNRCRTAQGATLSAGASSGNPDAKAMVPFVGNLTWQALKRVNTLDDPERELLMSIVGTVIYYSTDQSRDPDVRAPTLSSITELLYGQADAGSGFVIGHQLKCDEWVSCMNVSDDTTSTFKPFTTKVEEIMTSISDKIANRTGVPTAQEIGFVNTVSEPVYRMLAIGNAVKGSGQADALIQKYREVIATDYAYNFLEQYFRVGMAALDKDFALNTEQKARAREMRDRVQGYLHALALEKQAHYGKVAGFNAIASELEQLDRQQRASMPQHVIDMLGQRIALTAR